MNNPISPEQALEIFNASNGYKDLSGRFVFNSRAALQEALNLAITKYFGEPVVNVHRNEAGQISLKNPDGSSWDISKHVGTALYARKE
jgi:hypothetical protein